MSLLVHQGGWAKHEVEGGASRGGGIGVMRGAGGGAGAVRGMAAVSEVPIKKEG
jgi:hypothetical protein